MTGARPLEPGEHAASVTLGGGMLHLGGPLPIPNAVVEGRHGVTKVADKPLDVHYGLNLTSLAFGIAQLHAGGSLLLAEQNGAVPALAVTDRVWFATNALGPGLRADPKLQAWGADQIELAASWEVGNQLLYTSLAQYFDFRNPVLTLTPAVGAVWDFGEPGGVQLQTELRWYGAHRPDPYNSIVWEPQSIGILGASIGFGYKFGGDS